METIRCNTCNSDRLDILFEKDGFRIVKFEECGLVYVNPRLTLD